ncbi:serine/threonine protein kinase [Dactylosporangium aurantiacum]|uniref:non-specific serine/threonine protein kinase n=1 Tax=Dactylosporangium aurantiacum TaxID=35754 RepID=A0A9Q9MQM7_9ACTN|nr:serine/threonine-protein kinase [Dactylosporangium aurantiacum]MDG6103229.1 serine/threonine-protein kinase [Dactylosporangium aurantiacum]UWZ57732.1 serine/threonine protein kinase [Dactylosporangium aurantiacum]
MRDDVDAGRQPDVQGQVLGGRYRLREQLGSGGMAVVWSATDEVLQRVVAVKMLAPHHAAKPESLRRIRAEARTAATLSHPNVAQVHDYGEAEEDGQTVPYVVMELVPGQTLEQRMAEGPVEPRVAFRICAEVAAALTAAHAADLVHRDIKPSNVIVTETGAKVVDFGIAASVSPGSDGTLPDEVLGTPSYLAPERLTDDAVEPASDVYALGVLLYKLLTRQLPWQVDNTVQLLVAHVYTEPAPLPSLTGVPDDVIDLCHRCLRKDPALRPDAPEAAAILAAAAGLRVVADERAHAAAVPAEDGEPSAVLIPPPGIRAASPSGPPPPAPAPRRPRTLLVAAGAAVALIAGGLVAAAVAGAPTGERAAATPPSATGSPGAQASPGAPGDTSPGGPAGGGTTTAGGGTPPVPGQPGTGVTAGTGTEPTGADLEPTAEPTTPDAQPEPQQRTLSSVGGSVLATCTADGAAHLLSWEPAETYTVAKVEAGPAIRARIAFKNSEHTVRMTVGCLKGVPSAVTTTN